MAGTPVLVGEKYSLLARREVCLGNLTPREWGDRRLRRDDERPMVFAHVCGDELVPAVTRRACGDRVRHEDLTPRPRAPGWTVGGPAAV
ncbi:hypothetical protein [Streptomyces sp.]|uniref:hypothetical protein n=1 Tax=Streptomyces sp. TaxID=1931 RepID=UPI002811818A|nr:hypothetical protein [Streptomyces sp.]